MPLQSVFDAEILAKLETVLDEVCQELTADKAGTSPERVISREELAKLILHYAQDGETDPVKLRSLVLKGIRRR